MDFGYEYAYQYDHPVTYHNGGNNSILTAILSIYLIVLTVIIIFALASYIIHSIGLYTIGKRLGKQYPWLAFIPFARDYFHGELAGEIHLKKRTIRNPGIWKLVLPIAFSVITGVFMAVIVMAGIAATMLSGLGIGIMMLVVLYVLLIVVAIAYSAAYMTLSILIDIQIYEHITSHNMAIVHSVLSSVVPLYEAIFLFVIRNREFNPEMGPGLTPPPAPTYSGYQEKEAEAGSDGTENSSAFENKVKEETILLPDTKQENPESGEKTE